MSGCKDYIKSSIGKKQIVAVSGLLLILYLIFHLSMNMLILGGPELYNFFPQKAHDSGALLRIAEAGLTILFLVHIFFTAQVVIHNRKSRKKRYAVSASASDDRSFATKTMPFTGAIILGYIIWHLCDFVFTPHHGVLSMVNGQDLGLYGLVYNSFLDPVRSGGYIVAMFAVGLHLSHAVQSVFQSFGFNHSRYTPHIQRISLGVGLLVAVLFSSIPLYCMYHYQLSL